MTLRVYPNPDAGPFPCDPTVDNPNGYVGARVTPSATPKRPKDANREAKYDWTTTYETAVVELVDTPYYRKAVRTGALLPADAATAAACGVPFEETV